MSSKVEEQEGVRAESPAESEEWIGLYLYLGKDDLAKHSLTEEELNDNEERRLQTQAAIRTLHQKGVPCFSRNAIQNLVDQINETNLRISSGEPAASLKFLLPAVDGSTVEIEVETGTTHPNWCGDRQEVVMADPFLYYRPYQQLIAACADPREFYTKTALCPFQICYFARRRDPRTNQLLPALRSDPLNKVRKAFEDGCRTWKFSEECKCVETMLRTRPPAGSVSRIIAFGNGTISTDNSEYSVLQHALMLTIRDVLQSLQAGSGTGIQCFAQDIVYTESDKAALKEVGITVLDDPLAFLVVSDDSVVLSFGPNIPVRQVVTDLARPAVMICDKVRGEQELLGAWSKRTHPPQAVASIEALEARLADPESPRLRNLIQGDYEEVGKLDDEFFAGARIYIRRPGTATSR